MGALISRQLKFMLSADGPRLRSPFWARAQPVCRPGFREWAFPEFSSSVCHLIAWFSGVMVSQPTLQAGAGGGTMSGADGSI